MFRKNDILELDIKEMSNLGAGIGHADGMAVFVKGAVSGDRVRAKVIKVDKKYLVARLEELLISSSERTDEAFCPAPEACGGCIYRHISYEHECDMKQKNVKGAFLRAGLSDVVIEPLRTTSEYSGYRNKAQYPFALVGGKLTVGFYAGKTHKVMPCFSCSLQPESFERIARAVCEFGDEKGYTVYDEESGRGLLRHLYLRYGAQSGEIMVCLVINGSSLPNEAELTERLSARFPEIKSILLNSNTQKTSVILGREYRVLGGREYIEDSLLGRRFRISPASFYQVNHDGAELLYAIAAERAALCSHETLLDLYCGIGTIGLCLASPETHLVGVEIVPSAVECAKVNAAANGFSNAEFFCGDAGDAENLVNAATTRCGDPEHTVVVVDPPRKGLDQALISHLADKAFPKIVYVSCDPDTLARDCARFRAHGYRIGSVTPVDMFPKTGHCETVVCLSREKVDELWTKGLK